MQRKGFNFFRSYYDVAKELSDKDRLAFYDALILEQFTGIKTDLKGMAKFAYISQKHSIDAQIVGFNQRLKRNDTDLQPISSQAPAIPPMPPPAVQEKEEEKGEEEEKIRDISKTTLEDCEKIFIQKTDTHWTPHYAKLEASKFYNFYAAKGWMVGKNKMKSLPHAIGGWISRCDQDNVNKPKQVELKHDGYRPPQNPQIF